jgi:hypothetical protein
MNLWGTNVSEKSQQQIVVPEDSDLLITRV